jgi:class 3 adenylate cyclase/pimeloyl-ACP methyl ester carboxylesterase
MQSGGDHPPVQHETRYARSGDVSIAYRVFGEGSFDVVFHPGFISHVELMTEMSTFQGRILERLASICRVIVFDQRGVGMSDRAEGAPSMETRMDDLRAVIDAAGSARVAIFSMGLGVPMTVLFAATYPGRATSLVLTRSFSRELWAPDYPWGWTPERQRAMTDAFQLLFFGRQPDASEALAQLSARYSETELAYFRRAAASPGTIATLAAMNREVDVRQVLSAVRIPTLLVHAVEDPAWPIDGARYMANRIPGARLVELPGQGLLGGANFDRMLDETERFLRGVWAAGGWDEPEPDRVLATVLFTDIVDSTKRAAELGDHAWHELLDRHHDLVRRQLARYRGTEVNTTGDGFVASFDGPARAIRCAAAIINTVQELGIEVRTGLHTGECELVNGKVSGIAVHIAARVATEASASEVLVSSTVKDLVVGSGISFAEHGAHELKGVPGQWHLYEVSAPASRTGNAQ